jgi:mannose-1-phosphate guanylyltransferase
MTSRTAKSPEIHAVLLVGGKGERFWPASTPQRPKQFLRIFSDKSMVAETVDRISSTVPKTNIHYVLPPHLVDILRQEIKGVKSKNMIIEPEGRNTAPAIALAARVLSHKPDAVMAVLPADHLISPKKTFLADLKAAARLAQKGYLVTFGIPPSRPETGYGYIEIDSNTPLGRRGFKVKRFREKPDKRTANRYLKSGNFFWNSGMFTWKVSAIIEAFREYHSQIYKALLAERSREPTKQSYARLEATSVDYAIMEKAQNVAVVPARFCWDDVGSWSALERHLPQGLDKNTRIGKLVALESEGCIVYAPQGEVVLLGVRDLVVVRAKDTVLVCAKDRAADVKKLLERRTPLKP